MIGWTEKLLVPFFTWASISFIPLWLAYRVRSKALTAAVGQVMMFRRDAYERIGGHDALGSAIVDDLILARRIKAAGLRWRVVRVSDLVTCRMYHTGREVIQGFTKNLFAAFDFRLLIYSFVFLWLAVLFLTPIVILPMFVFGYAPNANSQELIISMVLSLLLWIIPYWETGVPLYLAFLYPVTVLAIEGVALRSLFSSLTGTLSWKDRKLAKPKWKWL